jgi:nucleoside 2-deoxyribosyltransferase
MKDFLVYLAGPISGLTYGKCTDWRQQVQEEFKTKTIYKPSESLYNSQVIKEKIFNPYGFIKTLSPLRGKQYLEQRSNAEGKINDSYEEYPLSSAKGINARDHWDCFRCDLVLVNFLGAEKVSIGTCMEIAWAFAYKKPVILCMEEDNIHNHAMIRESSSFIVHSLEAGIEVLKAIAGTDNHLN